MYKLSVVDDEPVVLERLTKIIESIDPSVFMLTDTFTNGDDAYNQLSMTPPDILITDIEIPFINGLQLIRMLKRNNPLLKVIVITGYDQIDYAKEAIDLGVIGFISKPIYKEELQKVLYKAKGLIEQEYYMEANINELASFFKNNIETLKENHLNKLTTVDEVSLDYLESLDKIGLFLDYKYKRLAVFDFDNSSEENNIETLWGYIKKEIKQQFNNFFEYNIFEKDQKIYVLFKSNEMFNETSFEEKLDLLITKLNRFVNLKVSIGLSNIMVNAHRYNEMYNQANTAISMRRAFGGLQVFDYNDLKIDLDQIVLFDQVLFDDITYKVKFETNLTLLQNYFNEIKDKLNKNTKSYVLNISNILNSILKSVEDKLYINNEIADYNELYVELFKFKTTDDLVSWFYQLALSVQSSNLLSIENRIDYNMEKIIAYIDKNYSEPSLNLDTLADEMNYSVSYITSLFKKNKNTTFVKYLTNIRMIKAKELLLNSNYKIIEISEQLGFNEPYYFSHCFKKHYGMSPKEFKDANLSTKE